MDRPGGFLPEGGTVPETRRWRVALYVRLSREDGSREEDRASASVENQRQILLDWLREEFRQPHELADVYQDDGLTGTDTHRPGFQRMLEDIESGRVDCVVCKALSRMFRNYADQGYYLEDYFPRRGVRFICIGSPFIDSLADPRALSNSIEIPINGILNDRYAAKTSEEVRRTLTSKKRRGEYTGAFAPYGYVKDSGGREAKNHILVDGEAAEVVREIYRWYVHDGMSLRGIAARLNGLGIPNPAKYKRLHGMELANPRGKNDGLWNPRTVGNILENEMYTGTMVQGKTTTLNHKTHTRVPIPPDRWIRVPGTHQAIVSRELFQQAARLRRRDTRAAPDRNRLHLFSGFLRCGSCGGGMTRSRAGDGRYVYYKCRTHRDKGTCSGHSMREDRLERVVLAAVRRQLALLECLPELLREPGEAGRPQRTRLEQLLDARLRELERVRWAESALYVDWKTGAVSRERYQRVSAQLERETERLQEVTASIRESLREGEEVPEAAPPALRALRESGTIPGLSRALLVELVEAIHIQEGGGVEIFFRYTDPFGESAPQMGS